MISQIQKALATKFGVLESSFRLMLDGKDCKGTATPKMMECEDGDQIEAVLEQVGGNN